MCKNLQCIYRESLLFIIINIIIILIFDCCKNLSLKFKTMHDIKNIKHNVYRNHECKA